MLIVYYLTTMMCHVTKIICYIYSAIILSCFTLQKSLAQTTNIAEFLHRVAVNNERTQTFKSGVKLASTPLHTQLSNLQTPASPRQTTQIDTLRPPTQSLRTPAAGGYGDSSRSVTQLPTGLRDVTSLPPTGRSVSGSSGLGTSRYYYSYVHLCCVSLIFLYWASIKVFSFFWECRPMFGQSILSYRRILI